MKKILVMGLVALMSVNCMAQTDDYKYLNAESTTGNKCVVLSNVKKITFENDNAVINVTEGDNVTIALSELKKITFSAEPTLIESLKGESKGLKVNGGNVSVGSSGLMMVYDMSGKLVSVAKVAAGQSVSLGSLSQGTFIIRLGNETIKVVR